MDFEQFYSDRSAGLARQIGLRRARVHGFVVGEITLFLGAVACLALAVTTAADALRVVEGVLAAVCLAAYIVVRKCDTDNDARIARLEDLRRVYDNELCARRGDFSCFDDGLRYADPHHAYSYDLDIFGKDSLYQRMNRMVTTGGCDALAGMLVGLDGHGAEPRGWSTDGSCDEAYRREVEALAADERWRAEFVAYGVREKIDTEAIGQALRAAGEVRVDRWFGSPFVLALAIADLVGFAVCVAAAFMGKVNALLPIWWGILQFFAIYVLCMGILKEVGKAVNRLHGQVRRLAGVAELMDEGGVEVFRRLTGLLDGMDKRGNVMGLMLVDTFALYDYFLVRKFLKWTQNDLPAFYDCIGRVVEMDCRVTISTFLYNHPDTCWPEVVDADGVTYEACGLYHPFLGAQAVRNDFRIDDRHFYIITGANMAGKSTFLRSIGVNYVLAMIGLPVFATAMRVSRFKLFSSMRTTDDLAHGISYFNAELLRLRQLISGVTAPQPGEGADRPTLIILDEILKGTNSLDKLNGSRLFLEHVARLPVSGVVATHDLELSKMEGERYHNYCFEIELSTDVTYSYKITPGVARNQNATFLLKKILNDR